MSCESPKWIYNKGTYKELNWRMVKQGVTDYEVGCWANCGVCSSCQNRRSNDWLVRNVYESKHHVKKSFITLTYEYSPLILVKKDLQDFVKRLRINLDRSSGEKIRIFTAGEYGDVSKRPHYHLIIYGWQDDNAKYLDINKKGNLYYKSDLIKDTWGRGRISYQKFNENEIPYLSLYNTANETFKKEYLLNKESLKKLESYAYSNMSHTRDKNLFNELENLRKKVEKSKNGYIAVKEFNTWSRSMGWESFIEEYSSTTTYAFEHPIVIGSSVSTYATPSSWLKKLANIYGDVQAMEELERREALMETETNKKLYKGKVLSEINAKKKTDVLDYKKTGITEL